MKIAKRDNFRLKKVSVKKRRLTRLLLVDILPTLLLLLAMAFGMAYVANKATTWPPAPERTASSSHLTINS